MNTKRIILKVDEELFDFIKKKSEKMGIPISTYIRIAMKKEFNEESCGGRSDDE